MTQNISTTMGVVADANSSGQAVDFDGLYVTNFVITNNSGVSIQYSPDGVTWTTMNNGATATPIVPDASAFFLRKFSSGGGPAQVALSWRSRDSLDPGNVAFTGGVIRKADSFLDRRNRKIFTAERLSEWSVSALGGTITEALDSADGYFAGGNIITMAQTTTAGPKNVLTSPIPLYMPGVSQIAPWIATGELTVALGQFVTITATDTAATNVWSIQVGAPNNSVKLDTAGGGTSTVNPTNWDMTKPFRVMAVTQPATSTTGTVRFFLYYKDTSTALSRNVYLGALAYTTSAIPSRFIVTQSWVALGNVSLARFVSYEFLGVMNGCSIDAGYVGWAPDPETARTFAATSYSRDANPALQLARRVNGDGDWYVNHAHGGWLVSDMLSEFTNFVLNLSPKVIVIGSATNSLVSALQLSGVARDNYIAQAKADYLSMATQAVGSGSVVLASGVAPRHDATPLAQLSAFRAMSLDWNAWMASTLKPLKIAVADFYSDLEDPAVAGQLVSWADAGDHVHFTYRARKVMADRQYQALMSTVL